MNQNTSMEILPPETSVMTGGARRERFLLYQLLLSMRKAERIDIIVSFLMESGVKLLISELENALDRGVKIRILTGNYLGITQPSALYLLKHRLGDRADLRFYSEKDRSFHAKSYIFHYKGSSDIFIGSSNISRSALTSGIEWNYRFNSNADPKNYQDFYETFEDLFEHHSVIIDDAVLKSYSKNWHRPYVQKDLERYDLQEEPVSSDTNVRVLFEPRGAQIEALCALENTRAEEMAAEFVKRGTAAAAVYSDADGKYSMDREEAVARLKTGEIQVIFSVDMFNEGVDIPNVDMVLFLRPTESPVVFLQQLGRGLRKAKGKEYLTVLDFIGNYEKAGRVRFLLAGDDAAGSEAGAVHTKADFPDDCRVDFDLRLIDLFREMDQKQMTVKERIRGEYIRIEETLMHRPSRIELFTHMDDDVYDLCMRYAKDNIFKNYLEFLSDMNRLTLEERELYDGIAREFLHLLETTSMTKVYKMPVLQAFYNEGNVRMKVTADELLAAWKAFFGTGTNWKDLKPDGNYADYLAITDKEHLRNIMNNPVHFLLKSGQGFFVEKEGCAIALNDGLNKSTKSPAFGRQMGDIISYRTMDYYRRRYRKTKET